MPVDALICGGGVTFNASPRLMPLVGDGSPGLLIPTEANAQTALRTAGTLQKLTCGYQASVGANAVTVVSRINGASGNQTVTTGAAVSTGIVEDTTHTDTIAAGDLVCYQVTNGTTVGTLVQSPTMQYIITGAATGTMCSVIGNSSVTGTSTASATQAVSFAGTNRINATEANVQTLIPVAGTLANMQSMVATGTNLRLSTTDFVSRINGSTGNMKCSYLTLVTGLVEDTTHTDTITAGALVNYAVVTGTGGNGINWRTLKSEFTTANYEWLTVSSAEIPYPGDGASHNYVGGPLAGGQGSADLAGSVTAEQRYCIKPRLEAFVMSLYSENITTNTAGSTTTFGLRDNDLNGVSAVATNLAVVLTVTAGATGQIQDTTHTATVNTAYGYCRRLSFSHANGTSITTQGSTVLFTGGPDTQVKSIDGLLYSSTKTADGLSHATNQIKRIDGVL